jgi:hypothetical protein
MKLYPAEKDRGLACQIAFEWPNDQDVMSEIERLKIEGTDKQKGKPSKEEMIKALWNTANNAFTPAKDKNAAIRIIAEIKGDIAKVSDGSDTDKRMPTAPQYKIVTQ